MRTFEEKTIGRSQFLICGLQPDETVDTVSLGMMANNRISGLLPMIMQQVDGIPRFQFDITGKQPFVQYLSEPGNGGNPLELLGQIASIVDTLQEYMIEEGQLVFDDRYIYVDQEKRVFLICVPCGGQKDGAVSFREYCSSVVSFLSADCRPPAAQYQALIDYLAGTVFAPRDFSEEIKKALVRSAVERSKSNAAPVVLERSTQNRASSGPDVLRHNDRTTPAQLDHTVFSGEQNRSVPGQIILRRNSEPVPDSGTVLLQKDGLLGQMDAIQAEEELTTPLPRNKPTVRGFLRRQSTSEKIEITRMEFRIGKSYHDVDYRIDGNPAVSRYHAKIIRRGDDFFIVDTNSKNHTYVNRNLIDSNHEVLLTDATSIRLANEEFVFLLSR
ncbi:MAG: FHA domain-containing protein [Clostridiales bacterium]|nr:FHA domain-containing protein [Clostridiales bacterium]